MARSNRSELDSHADTCSFGKNAYLVNDTGQRVTVEPFISSLGDVKEVPIVTAAVAYDDPVTFHTYILFFPQSLYFKNLDHNLLCPQQLRHFQVTVNETPLLYIPHDERKFTDHSIITNPPQPELHIPLELEGTVSYFKTRKPTREEVLDPYSTTHIYMTSDSPWEPSDISPGQNEASIRASLGTDSPLRGRSLDGLTSRGTRSHSPTSVAANFDSYFDELEKKSVSLSAIQSKNKKGYVTPEVLSKRWKIGLETARRTLEKTTQMAVRDFTNKSGSRRLKPFHYQLKYPRLNVEMFTDTFIARMKSLMGNTCAQIYATSFHWVGVWPMKSKSEAHFTLDQLFSRVGVPRVIIPDNAKEMTQGQFRAKALRAQSTIHPIEAYTPNLNIAEDAIRELKRTYRRLMIDTRTPECLWDLCLVYTSYVRSHSALNIRGLNGDVPQTLLTGDTPDISFLVEFGWYDYVWYLSEPDEAMNVKFLGRYVGPSWDIGDVMCARILTEKGTLISRTSVFPLSDLDNNSDAIKQQKQKFEETLKEKLKDRYETSDPNKEDETPKSEIYEPIREGEPKPIELEEADDMQHEAYNKYISARVRIPQGDSMSYGTVKRRKRDSDGNLIGKSNDNPLLDTAVYEVEFDSGETEAYHANQIAEALWEQVDSEGYNYYTFAEITDHKTDETAILKGQGDTYRTKSGRVMPKRTTRGWYLSVQRSDGTTSWESLKDMKDHNPVQVAEYAVTAGIDKEPAFVWWVPHVLKKRDRILKAMKKRYFRKTQKYGIEMPKTVQRALEIDRENGNTLWRDALRKEMKNVMPAFEIMDDEDPDPIGFTKINCHIVFDIKSDFTRKCRLVAGGHMTDPPSSITYASVVSRESVRIAFLYAALNDLDIKAADIGNAYLNAPCREKIYITCGPEFGPLQGKRAKVVKALYGLKSSGAAWRAHLAETIRDSLGFINCKADNDVWIRPAQKANGERYYEMILVYTDDILAISTRAEEILNKLDQHFLLKPESIGEPKQYLGASIKKYTFPDDGSECWAMGSEQYVKEAVRNVKTWLENRGHTLKTRVASILPSNYAPELDATPLCDADDANYYQQQIGVLRWAVELGRIDICTEVSIMSSYNAAPREGHLGALMHMFAYLDKHPRSHLVFDPSYPNNVREPMPDWSDFYQPVQEALPPDMPEPLGKPVEMTGFIDSDHAGNKVTRRSRTGVLVFLNRAPIIWYSKKQGSIETSSFGSEFSAMKTGVEIIEGLRYKLRMMGIPLDGPAHVKADNMSVVTNVSRPESTLKKKSNSIAYHYVRERCAAGVVSVTHELSENNLADMLTKIQPGPVRKRLVEYVLH